jgi:hypothetical protein
MIDHPVARVARWTLALVAWVVLSFKLDPKAASGAEQGGYVAASIVIPLLIAALIRVVYVRLRGRDRKRFFSPWLFYLAGIIGFVLKAGEMAQSTGQS